MASVTNDDAGDPLNKNRDIDYLMSLGPVQPIGVFKTTEILVSGGIKWLCYQESWYEGRPWLEYSSVSDAAWCFYCRIFKPVAVSQLYNFGRKSVKYMPLDGFLGI